MHGTIFKVPITLRVRLKLFLEHLQTLWPGCLSLYSATGARHFGADPNVYFGQALQRLVEDPTITSRRKGQGAVAELASLFCEKVSIQTEPQEGQEYPVGLPQEGQGIQSKPHRSRYTPRTLLRIRSPRHNVSTNRIKRRTPRHMLHATEQQTGIFRISIVD